MVVVLLFAGAAGRWTGVAWFGLVVTGMGAGLLLGLLLVHKPRVAMLVVLAAVALAAFAGGALLAGAAPGPASIAAAGAVGGALAAYGLLRAPRIDAAGVLRGRRVDAAGLPDAGSFAWTAVVAAIVLPWAALLGAGGFAGVGTIEPALLLRGWLAGALGVLATLPLLLAWPARVATDDPTRHAPAHPGGHAIAAVLAWLPVPVALWYRPEWLVLALLPGVLVAARIGPRMTVSMGLLTALVVAGLSLLPTDVQRVAPELMALPACVALLAALVVAILAAQRDRGAIALAAAREHLLAVTERAPALVATLDADLRHEFSNPAYLQWLGREAGQVAGRSLLEVYGDAAGMIIAPVRRAFSGQPQRQQIVLPDGRAMDAILEPRFGADGRVDGVHLLAQDAGWRFVQERSLEAMLAAARDPAVVLDAAGAVVRLNDAVATLLGVPREAVLGQPFARWLEPSATTALAEALVRLGGERQPQKLAQALDLHARRGDDSTFPVELDLAPMDTSRGIQAVVSIHDLGPRLAQEQLQREARGQAQVALDSIAEAVVSCDLHERITAFNPAAVRLSGWAGPEALGQPLGEVLRFTDPANDAAVPSLMLEAIRGDVVRQQQDKQLVRRDGGRVAVLESAAPIHDRFGQVSGAVAVLHDVSKAQVQVQALAHQALHDPLTGLPNRLMLQDRLSQALSQVERGYKGALLYLDLDHFKPINDRLGHPVGDRVLQEVAARLRVGVRQDDTVSRQGGDEFVLLLVRLADPRDAARVAGKLIDLIEQPIRIDGQDLAVSASIGIALFPQDAQDTGTLTRQADAALYHAKQGGRGRYSYFTDIMGASAEERMRTEHDLRVALASGDFFLAWQPQVRLPPGSVDGVEALVRWRRSDGVVVAPDEFIPVAEETGLVAQIDEWVLHAACAQNRLWQQQGMAPLPVSVNVSLARFDAERLLGHVRGVLDATGLEPRWLEMEFKSAQLFEHGARAQALVAGLKAMGVRVAADDFGSGNASLGALSGFAFDTLKIDREFVQTIVDQVQSRSVARAILGIGQAMDYRVIAKGVETDAQREVLAELGCTGMQGLMFGQAGPADGFAALVASRPGAAGS